MRIGIKFNVPTVRCGTNAPKSWLMGAPTLPNILTELRSACLALERSY
ncbi:hypothetical protein [Oscillatoria sp. FACHB-1406]|nr:hypothetical protein [Oscillatoria sp. FACHB-1406]MBD2580638.1 hypothetical protein [Oscillatoria sp. FACHB-1406]